MLVKSYKNLWRQKLYFKISLTQILLLATFADIIKAVTMFIKTIFKYSKNTKKIRNYVPKSNLYLYFWSGKLCCTDEKMLMSAKLKWCITWFICLLDLLWVRYNCAKFHNCSICVRDGGPFWSSLEKIHPE